MSVKNEDGFKAWQKLHMHFGPSLSAKQGMALADFSGMVAKPATKPGETKSLITELERRMKMVEEVTGELISDNHAKSVLVGILDPMTRQPTAMHHGGKEHGVREAEAGRVGIHQQRRWKRQRHAG